MEFAFTEKKFSRVYSYMKEDNIPSRKVAEKNGMIFQKRFSKLVSGEMVDEVFYLKEREWPPRAPRTPRIIGSKTVWKKKISE